MSFLSRSRILPLALTSTGILGWKYYNSHENQLRCDSYQGPQRFFRPSNQPQFPDTINIKGKKFDLVSSGTRRVTFLSIAVYDVGIYMDTNKQDMSRMIQQVRAVAGEDSSSIRSDMLASKQGDQLIDCILDMSMAIRITPTRNTDIAHMRDGFVRGVLARFEPDESSLKAFKGFFPNPRRAFAKNQVMLLTSWRHGDLELDIDGHDYGSFSGKGDDAKKLIKSFLATYISGAKVASEPVRQEFVKQIADIVTKQPESDYLSL